MALHSSVVHCLFTFNAQIIPQRLRGHWSGQLVGHLCATQLGSVLTRATRAKRATQLSSTCPKPRHLSTSARPHYCRLSHVPVSWGDATRVTPCSAPSHVSHVSHVSSLVCAGVQVRADCGQCCEAAAAEASPASTNTTPTLVT